MHPSFRHLGLLASLALGLVARADTALAPNSPFAPPSGTSASATENQPLELRGIMRDGSGYRFSIYDPAKKSGQWVRLNETGHDFTVRSHDANNDTVSLDFQGRVLTLVLRTAKVVAMAVPDHAAMQYGGNSPRQGGGMQGTGPVARPASPEEAARFNRAVEEINRRRAQREKGLGSVAAPMYNGAPMPGGVAVSNGVAVPDNGQSSGPKATPTPNGAASHGPEVRPQ